MKQYLRKYALVLAYLISGFIVSFAITWLLGRVGIIPTLETRADIQTKITSTHFFLMISCQVVGFILPAFLFARFKDFTWFPVQAEIRVSEVILAFLSLMALNFSIMMLYQLLGLEVKQFEDFNKDLLRQRPLTFLVTVGLLVPFYEEFIFRSIVLSTLWPHDSDSLVARIAAVFFTSVFFMLPHLEKVSNWAVLPPVFLLSVFLCLLTIRKKGILLSVIIHALQNFLAGLAFLYVKVPVA